MKKVFLLLTGILFINFVFGQKFDWVVTASSEAPGGLIDFAYDVEVDASGNFYVYGITGGTITFPPLAPLTANSGDAYLVKYNAIHEPQWISKISSTSGAVSQARIDIDDDGNVYICGSFISNGKIVSGTDSVAGFGNSNNDVFIVKINNTGATDWVRVYGGVSTEYAYDIAVGPMGRIYVAGSIFFSGSFGAFNFTTSGSVDGFVFIADSLGNVLDAEKFGGSGNENITAIKVDDAGNSYICGSHTEAFSFGSILLSFAGASKDNFAAKIDNSLEPVWAIAMGGSSNEDCYNVAIDNLDQAYFVGSFQGTIILGDTSLTSLGSADIYLTKISATGEVIWANRGGGASFDEGTAIEVAESGNVFVTGYFFTNASFNTINLNSNGARDPFIAVYNPDGTIKEAQRGGGNFNDQATELALNGEESVIIVGQYYSNSNVTFPPVMVAAAVAQADVFVTQYSIQCTPVSIVSDLSNQTVTTGDSVVLTVAVSGSAPFTYNWTAIGSPAGSNSPSLTIANFKGSNAGEYFVSVTNACGSTISTTAILSEAIPVTEPVLLWLRKL